MRLQIGWLLKQSTEMEIPAVSGGGFQLKIELYERVEGQPAKRRFKFRVLRYDTFRMQPQAGGYSKADHECLVTDPMFDGEEISAENEDAAWEKLLRKINAQMSSE
jgi:hypothetical protein